jgi:NADPH-dependent 2,4-dienoyl-CoA reductase/sulfur reductase-like enzyme
MRSVGNIVLNYDLLVTRGSVVVPVTEPIINYCVAKSGSIFVEQQVASNMEPLPRRKRAADEKCPVKYVIVGGGIAGVSCAQELRRLNADIEVTILTESDTIVAVRQSNNAAGISRTALIESTSCC